MRIVTYSIALLLILSCSSKNKLNKETNETAASINKNMLQIKEYITNLTLEAEKLYSNATEQDLDISTLDVENGGVFKTFDENKYYYKVKDDGGAGIYFSPMKPVTDDMKKEVKRATLIEPYINKTYPEIKDIINVINIDIITPYTIALLYPYYNMPAIFPPALDLTVFEWFQRGYNSERDPVWVNFPFADLYRGWVIDISMPLYINDSKSGVTVISVLFSTIVHTYIEDSKYPLLLIAPDMTLLGISDEAKKYYTFKVLEDVDYLQQMRENKLASAVFKISDESQPEEIQKLSTRITKDSKPFIHSLGGSDYYFSTSYIPEIGYYVTGFIPVK